MISLVLSGLSVVPAFFYFQGNFFPLILLGLTAVIKGVGGNNLPLSWAGIADTQDSNVRLSLGLSTSAIALGYLALITLRHFLSDQDLSIAIFFMFSMLFIIAYRFFFDLRDKKDENLEANNPSIKKEIILIFKNFLSSSRFRQGLCVFLFWEISFYSAHMLDVDLQIQAFKGLTLSMILGYLVGVGLLWRFSLKTDYETIRIGYIVSIISFVPMFALFPFLEDHRILFIFCYFFYSLGAAFLGPSLFSVLSKERGSHEQGKIYGLLDSTDTIAFLFATTITIFYSWLNLSEIAILIASSGFLIASWWPYAKFKKRVVDR
jgi:hypothetical protein